MVTAQDQDRDLVLAIQQKTDRKAFEELLNRYQEKIYQFCFRFIGNTEDAADCSQEIFIKIYQHIGQFNYRSKFSTWIYRITINTCQDMVKSKSYKYRQRSVELEQPDEDSAGVQVPANGSIMFSADISHRWMVLTPAI